CSYATLSIIVLPTMMMMIVELSGVPNSDITIRKSPRGAPKATRLARTVKRLDHALPAPQMEGNAMRPLSRVRKSQERASKDQTAAAGSRICGRTPQRERPWHRRRAHARQHAQEPALHG